MDRFRIRTMDLIAGAPTKAPEIPEALPGDESGAISVPPPEDAVTRDGATP
jgi:hypothetical protein